MNWAYRAESRSLRPIGYLCFYTGEIAVVKKSPSNWLLSILLTLLSLELNIYVGQLTPRQKEDPAVKHALEVQRAQATGNYHKLCDLYIKAPYMGAYIMDHFIDRERMKALMVITKAYVLHWRPECSSSPFRHSSSYKTIGIAFLQQTLSFDSIDEIKTFLAEHQITTFINPNNADSELVLDCKPAIPTIAQSFENKYRKVKISGAI